MLVTAFDIIFFWVARMMMMGLHFTGKEPFHTVYVHALVRDEKGAKMSKSKGNVIDPLDMVEDYGADALRFTLAALAAQGRDIRISPARVAGYRNFVTKLWNAARFCEMNGCDLRTEFDPTAARETVNRWIVGEVAKTRKAVDEALADYRFNEAAGALYQFVWGTFCDWYLEFAKPLLADDGAAAETRACAGWVLKQSVHLLHPLMPFVTEELWLRLGDGENTPLILADWPEIGENLVNADVAAEMDWVVGLITAIRSARSEINVPAAAKIPLVLNGAAAEAQDWLERHWPLVARLARLEAYTLDAGVPQGAVEILHHGARAVLPLAGVVDLAQEQARLEKAVAKASGEITKLEKKLANQGFLAKAPEAVVAENKERLAVEQADREKLLAALERVKGAAG